jgi:excisionase family DNA binding protein
MTPEKPVLALTIRDACAAIGCGRTKLYELINDGELDARALGGRTVIPAASLHKLIANLPPAPIKGVKQA